MPLNVPAQSNAASTAPEGNVIWHLKPFHALSPAELYAIMRARAQVFVLEQQCLYQDFDGYDQAALHLLAASAPSSTDAPEILAYCRLLKPGSTYQQASIGRVLTSTAGRGRGLARAMMQRAIAELRAQFAATPIKIGAQCYLEAFYQSLGFVTISERYLEDDIPHVHMLLDASAEPAQA